VLSSALAMLAPGGACVHFGVSEAACTSFDCALSRDREVSSFTALYLFDELRRTEPATQGLALLAQLIAERVRPRIAIEAPWSEVGAAARSFIRENAVLHLT